MRAVSPRMGWCDHIRRCFMAALNAVTHAVEHMVMNIWVPVDSRQPVGRACAGCVIVPPQRGKPYAN